MKRLKIRFLGWIYLLLTIPYVLALISQKISPEHIWPLAFLGLGYPVLLGIQLLFSLYFIIRRRLLALLPILIIALTLNPITNTFQIFGNPKDLVPSPGIMVMSYNVRLFDFFGWSGVPGSAERLVENIQDEQPAVVCFQEFMIQTEEGLFTLNRISKKFSWMPYQHLHFNFEGYKREHGLAIFSKYPIVNRGTVTFENTRSCFTFADLRVDERIIRVYNAHLQSIHIYNDDELKGLENQFLKRAFTKVKLAFKKRAEQARTLKEHADQSPYPVIICGDFNDTPISYATHTIRDGLMDSFRESGRGFGATYQHIPWLRIDYILHDDELSSSDHRTGPITGSDHRPVMTTIRFKDQ